MPDLYETGLMKQGAGGGVNIILRYLLTGFLYFNCVPNLDLRWGGVCLFIELV